MPKQKLSITSATLLYISVQVKANLVFIICLHFWIKLVSKLFIFLSALKANQFSLVFISILFSIIGSFYYLKFIKIIFFEKTYKKIFMDKINKLESIIILLSTQFILFYFIFPNIILINLNKIYLYLLI